MKQKCNVFLLCIMLSLAAIPANAIQVWDGTSKEPWTKGGGTQSDPYLIESPANLAYLSNQVQNGNVYKDICFLQTDDIDLNNKSWTYIGVGESKSFSGIYDGGQKQIINVKNYLFGYVKSATIQNLTIAGTTTYSMVYNAMGDVMLINCHNKSTADIENGGAGLIRLAENGLLTLYGCSNSAAINSAVLYQYQDYSVYPPTVNGVCLGGLIAKANRIQINKCVHKGDLKYKQSGYTRIANAIVAGIVGYADTIQMTMSGNNGGNIDIQSSSYGPSKVIKGGLIGNSASAPVVSQSYNVGDGGDVSSGTNSYCYAIMKEGSLGGTCINCYFVGQKSNNPVSSRSVNCYYNNDCSVEQTQYNKAIPKTKEMMKSPSFVSLLNVDGDYFYPDYTNINDGYPILRWQLEGIDFYNIKGLCREEQGTITGAGAYPKGAEIQLTATPKDNFVFAGWSDGVTDNPRTIKVEGEATYVAQFERTSYTVYVNQDCSITVE